MNLHMHITNDWAQQLNDEFSKDYFQKLCLFLEREMKQYVVYPERSHIFNALQLTSYADTKVVILGQDPYHGPGQAHGLSFSVQPGVPIPPSLKNMFQELQHDLGVSIPTHGSLIHWAKQGVLLLNTVLTVRQGEPNSHRGLGWETFTDRIIERLNERSRPIVFILWGSHAQKKKRLIDGEKHFILTAPHPSPLSAYRGFFGSRPYSRANECLKLAGHDPIDWEIP